MLELNPSKQCCPPRFLAGTFKFYRLLLGGEEKKTLMDLSFKFNEIKFCIELVNLGKNVHLFL